MAEHAGEIGTFADSLGTVLEATRQKAQSWIAARNETIKTLTTIRETADQLLGELNGNGNGHTAPMTEAAPPSRPGTLLVTGRDGRSSTVPAGDVDIVGRRQTRKRRQRRNPAVVNARRRVGRPPSKMSAAAPKKRTMSKAARKKISLAQKARWAKIQA